MKKTPYTPFSTPLSGSAKETEKRFESILKWKKARPPRFLLILVLCVSILCCSLVACRNGGSGGKTLEELCPGAVLSQCDQIKISYYIFTKDNKLDLDIEETLSREDPGFDLLLEQLESRKFRKSLGNLLPQGDKFHRMQEGDFRWEIGLNFTDAVLSDGTTGTGQLISLQNFFGELSCFLAPDGETVLLTTDDQEEWLTQMLDLISQVPELDAAGGQ